MLDAGNEQKIVSMTLGPVALSPRNPVPIANRHHREINAHAYSTGLFLKLPRLIAPMGRA